MKRLYSLVLIVLICFLTMPISSAHSSGGVPRVAIDVTRLKTYTPSFSSITSALNGEGYIVDEWWSGEITAARLDGYCCLIMVFPNETYSASEVTAILDFVSSGHGLLFLGEYGKNWGDLSSGIYPAGANPITTPMGITINNDLLYDPTDYEPSLTSWVKIHTFPGGHPITTGISIYLPLATATLTVDPPATTIATGDDDTYAVDPEGPDPECDSPPLVEGIGGSYEPVLAASMYGLGRAVVAGDHNWITDQGGYSGLYDNTQLLINIMDWICVPFPDQVIPEVPLGTIMASTVMIFALVGYFAIPKFRKKQ